MSHYYTKFKENPCVGTDASTPLEEVNNQALRAWVAHLRKAVYMSLGVCWVWVGWDGMGWALSFCLILTVMLVESGSSHKDCGNHNPCTHHDCSAVPPYRCICPILTLMLVESGSSQKDWIS